MYLGGEFPSGAYQQCQPIGSKKGERKWGEDGWLRGVRGRFSLDKRPGVETWKAGGKTWVEDFSSEEKKGETLPLPIYRGKRGFLSGTRLLTGKGSRQFSPEDRQR